MGSRSNLFLEILFLIQRKLNSTGSISSNNLQDEVLCAGWIIGSRWTKGISLVTAHHPEGGSTNVLTDNNQGFISSSSLPTPSFCKIVRSINMRFLFDKSDKL